MKEFTPPNRFCSNFAEGSAIRGDVRNLSLLTPRGQRSSLYKPHNISNSFRFRRHHLEPLSEPKASRSSNMASKLLLIVTLVVVFIAIAAAYPSKRRSHHVQQHGQRLMVRWFDLIPPLSVWFTISRNNRMKAGQFRASFAHGSTGAEVMGWGGGGVLLKGIFCD
ncbi:hypothetical protein LSH36_713g01029 [Paralvinella palmiformis]|uniref:Transmembrane protein n=1 Tax=Paralvinella palmiformis TaxID=53620 RepID=A0AAD9J1T3_9ANNE|nr:hypothetical protein LSH36_713g01029 [Paralvinella palmiformis]